MPTLFDAVLRHALYLEGARKGVSFNFRRMIVRGLDAEIIRAFQTTNVNNFGELTKTEFNRFVVKLRAASARVFEREGRKFAATMRELNNIEVSLFQRVFRADTGERVIVNRNAVWAGVRNRDIAATGGTMARAERQLFNSSVNLVETIARRGFADKMNTGDVLQLIRGVKARNFRDGALSRVQAWADSYSNTIVQHVGSAVKYDVSSRYYEEYDWISIIDRVTTEICIERAGVRYRYGEGPIPPAHYQCRSEIVPVNSGDDRPTQSFVDWLKQQPGEFLTDVFKAGRRDLDNVKVITLDEFKGKLEFILVG